MNGKTVELIFHSFFFSKKHKIIDVMYIVRGRRERLGSRNVS